MTKIEDNKPLNMDFQKLRRFAPHLLETS
jgi:hypothetical protein